MRPRACRGALMNSGTGATSSALRRSVVRRDSRPTSLEMPWSAVTTIIALS